MGQTGLPARDWDSATGAERTFRQVSAGSGDSWHLTVWPRCGNGRSGRVRQKCTDYLRDGTSTTLGTAVAFSFWLD